MGQTIFLYSLCTFIHKRIGDADRWLMFYGHFCAHGRLNGPSNLQR